MCGSVKFWRSQLSILASVNYHVESDNEQYFEIDVGGVPGELISPILIKRQVLVEDIRDSIASLHFFRDSVCFVHQPSKALTFGKADFDQTIYDDELIQLIKNHLGAKEVFVFDHTVRIDDEKSSRKPVRNVHSDYSEKGAQNRLCSLLGKEVAKTWMDGHYAFINVWRPIVHSVECSPLGFIRSQSVKDKDWEIIGLKYPDRMGEILGLKHSDTHEWFHLSAMTPDEVAIFNIHDNLGLSTIAHTALELSNNPKAKTRKSIESRLLVKY